MLNRLKKVILAITASSMLFAPMLVPVAVYAATDPSPDTLQNGLCQGATLNVDPNVPCTIQTVGQEGTDKVNSIITTVINVFSIVVGVVAVIMIIIGGLKYITSGGDSGNITGAKNTILYAVIGLVVVALAQFIVKFVLGKTAPAVVSAGFIVPFF